MHSQSSSDLKDPEVKVHRLMSFSYKKKICVEPVCVKKKVSKEYCYFSIFSSAVHKVHNFQFLLLIMLNLPHLFILFIYFFLLLLCCHTIVNPFCEVFPLQGDRPCDNFLIARWCQWGWMRMIMMMLWRSIWGEIIRQGCPLRFLS